jgi:hypothetical protein
MADDSGGFRSGSDFRSGMRLLDAAYARVEAELSAFKQLADEQRELAAAAERRALVALREKAALEQRLDEHKREAAVQRRLADQRGAELERENAALASRLRAVEHDTQQLELTVRALRKELSKLDSFKQSILTSIRDDSPLAPIAPPGPPDEGAPRVRGEPYGSGFRSPRSGARPSPPRASGDALGASAFVDGKDFFRLARSRLSQEQFDRFLANIKGLNDHTQSRDATLEQARQLFGRGNDDLFASFGSLLAHHGLA